MTPTDIATVRELITYAKANGWTHLVYGGLFVGGVEHLWRHGTGTYKRYAARVSLYGGVFEYRKADNREPRAAIRPESAAEVADWLRLLGLLPTVAQVAVAILTPDANGLPDDNAVYWRIYRNSQDEKVVVCMQWFDEADYDQGRFLNDGRYGTEAEAAEALVVAS